MRKLVVLVLLVLPLLAAVGAEADSASAAIIIGTSGVRPQVDQNAAGSVEAFRTPATATGSVETISVYVNATSKATRLYAGLYTDNNGHPGTLLTQGSTATPTPNRRARRQRQTSLRSRRMAKSATSKNSSPKD